MSEDPGTLRAVREWMPRAQRTTTTFLVARLLRDNGSDELCRVRNVSPGGMRIETPRPLEEHRHVHVEMRTGLMVGGTVVWVSPTAAGIAFDADVDVTELLSAQLHRPAARGGAVPRSPRFDAEAQAKLSFCGRIRPAILENVSQSGARLRLQEEPELVQGEMTVAIPGLEPKRAAMRWVADDEAGVVFLDKLKFQEFGHWLGEPKYRFGARVVE